MLLLVMTGFCATYVKSLSLIVQPLAPTVPSWILGALFAALVSGVVIPGGLLSVVRSDVVSFVTTLLLPPLFTHHRPAAQRLSGRTRGNLSGRTSASSIRSGNGRTPHSRSGS